MRLLKLYRKSTYCGWDTVVSPNAASQISQGCLAIVRLDRDVLAEQVIRVVLLQRARAIVALWEHLSHLVTLSDKGFATLRNRSITN